jgi:hypothetical protein
MSTQNSEDLETLWNTIGDKQVWHFGAEMLKS